MNLYTKTRRDGMSHTRSLHVNKKHANKHVTLVRTHAYGLAFTHTFSLSASLLSWHIGSTPHRVGSRLSGTLYHSPSLCGLSHYISFGNTLLLCQIYCALLRPCGFLYWTPSHPVYTSLREGDQCIPECEKWLMCCRFLFHFCHNLQTKRKSWNGIQTNKQKLNRDTESQETS